MCVAVVDCKFQNLKKANRISPISFTQPPLRSCDLNHAQQQAYLQYDTDNSEPDKVIQIFSHPIGSVP